VSNAYETAGVDYDTLDAAKRLAMELASGTLHQPLRRGASVLGASIGEPATLLELGGLTLAVVLECLGTKSMIAREVEDVLGLDRWDAVGVDAVAAIVNDLCCVGALPLTVNAYFATGSSGWYAGRRHASLVTGWRSACDDVGAAWVGGESPTLSGLIDPDQIDLAGSALGRVPEGAAPWLGSSLQPGDEIVVAASSGLHANGASLARALAASPERCPKGWAEELPSGRAFGDAVLDPSVLYPKLVEALFATEIPVHYASHVTGRGPDATSPTASAPCRRFPRYLLSWSTAPASMPERRTGRSTWGRVSRCSSPPAPEQTPWPPASAPATSCAWPEPSRTVLAGSCSNRSASRTTRPSSSCAELSTDGDRPTWLMGIDGGACARIYSPSCRRRNLDSDFRTYVTETH
jgi:phosphoribosylformylglycinamidine cyclo-ligase